MENPVLHWDGLFHPTRVLTSDEVAELGEVCAVCGMTAHVVECLQGLNEEERKHPLSTLDTPRRFTCGLHAPLDVPQAILDDIAFAFYQRMKEPLICPDKGWKKHYTTCLALQPHCLKRCNRIKDRLRVSIAEAIELIQRGKTIEERKQKEHNDAHTEPKDGPAR
jgi:hypothetical protein